MDVVLAVVSGRDALLHGVTQGKDACYISLGRKVGLSGFVARRNCEIERGTYAWFRLHPHFSAIGFDDLLSQRETDAGAWNILAMQALEDLEYDLFVSSAQCRFRYR